MFKCDLTHTKLTKSLQVILQIKPHFKKATMFEFLLNKPTFDLWTNNQKMQLVVDEPSSLFCSLNDEENFYDTDLLSINFWKTFMTRNSIPIFSIFFQNFIKYKFLLNKVNIYWIYFTDSLLMEQHILDTNAGKQLS